MIYYTQQDLADALGVSRQVIKNWILRDNGKLPEPAAQTAKGLPLWSEEQVKQIKKTPLDLICSPIGRQTK